MGGEGNDHEICGSHVQHIQVSMDHIPGRGCYHMVQPM